MDREEGLLGDGVGGQPRSPVPSRSGTWTKAGLARIKAWLPRGGELPNYVWERRHKHILFISYLVAIGCAVFGAARERSTWQVLLLASLVAVPALVAQLSLSGRTARSALASLALLNACAAVIEISGGVTEAHFSFFVVVGILTIYQDWVPFLIAIGYVVIHHGVMGMLMPMQVFDHTEAWHDPWMWAGIHGAFVLAASVTYVIAWRMNEEYRLSATEASERLVVSERRFRALVQRSTDATMVCDAHGLLSYVSPASADVLGLPDDALLGEPLLDIVDREDRSALSQRLRDTHSKDTGSLQCRIRDYANQVRWVEITFSDLREDPAVAGIVLHIRDVTDRRGLESELRHAQKMESIGQLAAGIAHEINTPIQYVGDNLRFLGDAFADQTRVLAAYRATGVDSPELAAARELCLELDCDSLADEVPEAIEQTLDGVDRVASIVRAMKAFGHRGDDSKAPADLNAAICNTLIIANNAIKDSARVLTNLGPLPPVRCHIGDINQVVLNLVVNAAQAIGGGDGKAALIQLSTLVDGADAVIEISDTGPGMAPEIMERIFEPFYTTKSVGDGTGQGLAIVHHLVYDRHCGSIKVESCVGVGTTFKVRIPIRGAETSTPRAALSGGPGHSELSSRRLDVATAHHAHRRGKQGESHAEHDDQRHPTNGLGRGERHELEHRRSLEHARARNHRAEQVADD